MPIPLPNLDDRTFDDLTAEARALIPALQPEWTNHNPSDPGITLVELLAWLTEMLLFQVNQVPPAHTEAFLRLLNGPDSVRSATETLDEAVRRSVLDLRLVHRAVTADDYEVLVRRADRRVRRVRCVVGRNLAASDPERRRAIAPAHVSVVVVPAREADGTEPPGPSEELVHALWSFLDDRRTLATRHHVVGPVYVPVDIAANLALHADAPPEAALAAAHGALRTCLDSLDGGVDGTGWPFGRALSASEVYRVLEGVRFVDYVEDVQVNGAEHVELDVDELPLLAATKLVAFDVHGRRREMAQ
jgi:hypothetical protein